MAAAASAVKQSRSQFIEKLHDLLENPHDADSLHWVSDSAFEISSDDLRARNALSPKFDFRSLSSFIRQLSYYSFKRLSDRRRSTERKVSAADGFIVFSHPSGCFVRGDNTQLGKIARKLRNRPDKTRRVSTSSAGSSGGHDETLDSYPMPQWPAYDERRTLQPMTMAPLHLPLPNQQPFGNYQIPSLRTYNAFPSYDGGMGAPPRRNSAFDVPDSPRSKRLDFLKQGRHHSMVDGAASHDGQQQYPLPPNFIPRAEQTVPSGLALPAFDGPIAYRHPFQAGHAPLPLPSPTDSIYSTTSSAEPSTPAWPHPHSAPLLAPRRSIAGGGLTTPGGTHFDYAGGKEYVPAYNPQTGYFPPQPQQPAWAQSS